MRIELRSFSHALANDPQLTLIDYLTTEICRYGSCTVDVHDLKSWLAAYPWLLVLDGLDEVPPSSNRDGVVKCIEFFRVDIASVNSDMMVVVTTRPQSYSQEFPVKEFLHLYLKPLSQIEALKYGKKLAIARCNDDKKRCDELSSSLEKACRNEFTARLMQSPLQVTIMATLLEETGEPPQQRYRLFAEYYRTIYKRETRRKLLNGILSERQTDIDIIHAHTGLLLQAYGEDVATATKTKEETADSALSDDQFRELVRNRLERIKVPTQKAIELLTRISDGSLQRLVFLVRSKEGWVRFDITSFKEFMAAEALMSGTDGDIRERIRTIAPASYWRNVLLFAIGRCFVEKEHMLDSVVALCAQMNELESVSGAADDAIKSSARKATCWGSRLAIDILLDGTTAQHPHYELQFARIALEIVNGTDRYACTRLAGTCHDDLHSLFQEKVLDRLGQTDFWMQLGGWYLLIALADLNVDWARNILHERWPNNPEHERVLLGGTVTNALQSWWAQRIAILSPKLEPVWFMSHPAINYRRTKLDFPWPHFWRNIASWIMSSDDHLRIVNNSAWRTLFSHLSICPLRLNQTLSAAFANVTFPDERWEVVLAAVRFGTNPSAKNLAEQLRCIASKYDRSQRTAPSSTPWPLLACLNTAASAEDLIALADKAEAGGFGDIKDWQAAEARWQEFGITDNDFTEATDTAWPFDSKISLSGFPFAACPFPFTDDPRFVYDTNWKNSIVKLHGQHIQAWLSKIVIQDWYEFSVNKQNIPSDDWRQLFSIALQNVNLIWRVFPLSPILDSDVSLPLTKDWLQILNELGKGHVWVAGDQDCTDISENLTYNFCADPQSWTGLLRVLTELAYAGCKCLIPKHILELVYSWGNEYRDEALILYFSRPDLTPEEVRMLVERVLQQDNLYYVTWKIIKVASSTSSLLAAQFSIELLRRIKINSHDALAAVDGSRQQLVDILVKQASYINNPSTWNRLQLPIRV